MRLTQKSRSSHHKLLSMYVIADCLLCMAAGTGSLVSNHRRADKILLIFDCVVQSLLAHA